MPVRLRAWQREALDKYIAADPRDWLECATPGAGKTTFTLAVAAHLWQTHIINRVIVVCPTDHLRTQWIGAAAALGFDLRDTPNSEKLPADAHGCVVTYAQVAQKPAVHAGRATSHRTLVIFDEIHHAGDQMSWGSAVIDAFSGANRRIGVTGTPFRSDEAKIAHVRYEDVGEGILESVSDHNYGYADALRDGVVRPVTFATYSGRSTWNDSAGEEHTAILGDAELTKTSEEMAWRTALDSDGEWIAHVMAAAWARVNRLRDSGQIPHAKVLIPASNQEIAKEYAEVWTQVTGDAPAVILSEDAASARKLAEYRDDPEKICAVCVRLITEGVDVPDAAVLIYSTTASTPLFFAQMVGRVVRARNRGERATVFLPTVTRLLALASEMEEQRDHVIGPPQEADPLEEAARERSEPGPEGQGWRAVASDAILGEVIDTYSEPAEDGGLFALDGLLTPDQERALFARDEKARAEQAKAVASARRRSRAAREAEERQERRDDLVALQRSGGSVYDEIDDPHEMRREISTALLDFARDHALSPQAAWGQLYREIPGEKNDAAPMTLLQKRLTWLHRH
ncbi:RNA helicase [Acidipropionibacterium acidipropionici]|nr:DEAD/DEAH box helicase family protein [Acidipropionibacterium acidipropionici]AMS04210.1 RNA helicase [Acidipropionibacterium acidipropionici]AOZ45703.1 RNA helicase [Acidipropionibacterium acidipropionici]AZP38288.1 RNA helicase [Acidipropionibacterium acidipropionici]MDN6555688.1 DEAD/DEAH box helicase family protein [Acidipropionibacterium acidipropionici]